MIAHIKDIINKISYIEPKIIKALKDEKVERLWRQSVDKRILKQTEAQGVKNKVFYVLTSTSAWANELTLLRRKFLEKINKQAGEEIATEIRFRVGRVDGKQEKEGREDKGRIVLNKCKKCGVSHRGGEEHCPVCSIKLRNDRATKIERCFRENLGADYSEAKREIDDLQEAEFKKAKRRAQNLLLDKISLLAQETLRGGQEKILGILRRESGRYIQAFGGNEDALLKKAMGNEIYKEFKALRKRRRVKRGRREWPRGKIKK